MVALMQSARDFVSTQSRQRACSFARAGKFFFEDQGTAVHFLLSGILVALLCNSNSATAQPEILENQVKAAFLYKFPAYVEWPASSFADAASPVVFGILAADATADELSLISQDNLLNGRTIVIKKLQPGDSTAGLNILFVGASQTRTAEPLLQQALSNSILTVTEAPAQRPDGSIINFAIIDERVRFDVSLVMAEQARLTVSSRLLQVARRVIEPNP